MVINLGPDLEAAVVERARVQGVTPEALAIIVLSERFLAAVPQFQPRDEWERRLLGIATNCGVALTHEAVGSEGLYE